MDTTKSKSILVPADVYEILKMRKRRTGVPIRRQVIELVENGRAQGGQEHG